MLTSLLTILAAAHAVDVPVPTVAVLDEDASPARVAAAPVDDGGTDAAPRVASRRAREIDLEVSFRSRWMIAPRAIVSGFGFEDDKPGYDWALRDTSDYCRDRQDELDDPDRACGKERPAVTGQAYGLETLLKWPKRRDTMIVYVDWVDSNMRQGYWDDREDGENPDDPLDGDYLVPGRSFGLLMIGVNYQADIPMVKLETTKNAFGMDFTVGAGLGAIVMLGRLDRYLGDAESPGFAKYDAGIAANPDDQVGRFWPAVDVNVGFKLNFADRVVLRLEGGLHTLFYAGGTLGFKF